MSQQAAQLSEELTTFISKIVGALVAHVTVTLRDATPVRTGHCASHWLPSLAYDTVGLHSPRMTPAYDQQSAAIEAIRKYRLDMGGLKITNPVDYTGIIDALGARGIAAGWIARAEHEAMATLESGLIASLNGG